MEVRCYRGTKIVVGTVNEPTAVLTSDRNMAARLSGASERILTRQTCSQERLGHALCIRGLLPWLTFHD
jgi:hypothetical protein